MLAEPSTPQRGRGTGEAIQVPNWNPGGGYAFSALLAIGIHAGMLFCLPKGRLFQPLRFGGAEQEAFHNRFQTRKGHDEPPLAAANAG